MRVLLDCTPLVVGGGIQAGLAVLEGAERTTGWEWHAAVSEQIARQTDAHGVGHNVRLHPVQGRSRLHKVVIGLQLRSIEREVHPDVVYTVFGPAYTLFRARHLQGFAVPRMIYPEVRVPNESLRERLEYRLVRLAKAGALVRAKFLVVETEIVRQRVAALLGLPKARIFVVGNTYSPSFRRELAALPARATGGHYSVLVPSSYYAHKNLESIPTVAQALRRSGLRDFTFGLTLEAGGRPWQNILARATALGVESHIRTFGAVPHSRIAELYRQADAVFLPTLLECSTAVYPEAFLAGVPVVTSEMDFAHALCKDAALFVDPLDAEAAAAALVRVRTEAGLATQLANRGHVVVEQLYITPEQKWQLQLDCLRAVART